jgi:hypothetical protein
MLPAPKRARTRRSSPDSFGRLAIVYQSLCRGGRLGAKIS